MVYELLKASHIVAVVIWFGGMMAVALLLRRGSEATPSLLTWDRYVTTPAMIAAWGLGLTMATWAGWFASGWMMAKMVLVLALSAVHGLLSGRLRRAAAKGGVPSELDGRLVLGVMLALLSAIVLLVVTKPF
ncbi:CopD family protein [Plastoroseomonas hellenica]|uniref:CopD family protein n=1 Tax=Plastoroseomonas hellenica TaxID=2687306 RepID=UPI001BA9CBC2|nr:CopD family protein [Plastoroseomonas hellenica]MBR0642690.1 hypothetical protein [Plastoroseomonas hellenica]